jgi:hypothetical protein
VGRWSLPFAKWGVFDKYEKVELKLLQALFVCGAEVRIDLFGDAIRWGQADVILELAHRIPPASHHTYSEAGDMLVDIAVYLENSVANQVIQKLFRFSWTENCMRCEVDHPNDMNNTFYAAARRKHRTCEVPSTV